MKAMVIKSSSLVEIARGILFTQRGWSHDHCLICQLGFAFDLLSFAAIHVPTHFQACKLPREDDQPWKIRPTSNYFLQINTHRI